MSRKLATAHDRAGAPLQARTAANWARLAIRAYERGHVLDGECHRGEALEHAALVSDLGRTAARIQKSMTAARDRAWARTK